VFYVSQPYGSPWPVPGIGLVFVTTDVNLALGKEIVRPHYFPKLATYFLLLKNEIRTLISGTFLLYYITHKGGQMFAHFTNGAKLLLSSNFSTEKYRQNSLEGTSHLEWANCWSI
jgi:hypothetical protein